MNAQMIDWNDIPLVLAICETGSLSGAARKLGCNHSTVFRRLNGLEEKLGVSLFERSGRGYVMTAAGEHFFQQGLELKERVIGIERDLSGQDLRLEGPLTVTTTDALQHRLTPIFLAFQKKFPHVELRLIAGTHFLDVGQRAADIALRPTNHPPEQLIGRKLLPIAYAIYAHTDYLNDLQGVPPEHHRWVCLDESMTSSPMVKLTALHKADGAPVTVTTSVIGVFDLVRAGLGIAALPCFLGEKSPELVRLHRPDPAFNSELWMLAHPDIRRSARIHAFFGFATEQIRQSCSDFFEMSRSSESEDLCSVANQ